MARKKSTKKSAPAAVAAPKPEQPAEFTPQPTPAAPAAAGAGQRKYGYPQVRMTGRKQRDVMSPRADDARAAREQPTETEEK